MYKLTYLLVLVALCVPGLTTALDQNEDSAGQAMLIGFDEHYENETREQLLEDRSMLGRLLSWVSGETDDDAGASTSLRGSRLLWGWNSGSGSCGGRSRFFSSCSNRDRFTTGNTGGGANGPNRVSVTRPPATTPAIVDIVATARSNSDFSTLDELVTGAGLAATLQGPGPFTVFAPKNEVSLSRFFLLLYSVGLPTYFLWD